MKNKYLKGAHISERKVRELLKLFCEDLTATQIANVSSVSRITVNAYLKLMRTHIARFCEERNPIQRQNGVSPGLPMHSSPHSLNGDTEEAPRKSMYGIFRYADGLYTYELKKIGYSRLYDWLRGKVELEPVEIQAHHLDIFSGVADFNTVRLFRINPFLGGGIKAKSHLDEIDLFWGMLKSRMVKFRGLNSSTLYLHVKETEFRYNFRQEDIFQIMMDILQQRPLHFSRATGDNRFA